MNKALKVFEDLQIFKTHNNNWIKFEYNHKTIKNINKYIENEIILEQTGLNSHHYTYFDVVIHSKFDLKPNKSYILDEIDWNVYDSYFNKLDITNQVINLNKPVDRELEYVC